MIWDEPAAQRAFPLHELWERPRLPPRSDERQACSWQTMKRRRISLTSKADLPST